MGYNLKVIKYLGKFIVAAIVAVLILSLIFSVYYLVPLRVENPDKNTDYKWESGAPWIRMEEGVSAGIYDANGFSNLEVVDNPDVLILGSSHMEAANVPQDQNTTSYLSQLMDGEMTVYNMGISGHTFAKVCQYIPQTLEVYDKAPKYIVIETSGTSITADEAQKILDHSIEKTSVSKNQVLNLFQRVPFFRTMYYQLDGGLIKKLSDAKGSQSQPSSKSEEDSAVPVIPPDSVPYDKVFAYLQSLQEEYHTKLIIMYHPTEELHSDGTVTFPHDASYDVFAGSAKTHDLMFVDATAEFEKMYDEKHALPHGFITGKLGEGHLNSDGHYAVALSLYRAITEDTEVSHADN